MTDVNLDDVNTGFGFEDETPAKQKCEKCGKEVSVRKNGELYAHKCNDNDIDIDLGNKATAAAAAKQPERIAIIVDETETESGALDIGVNGQTWQIPRGKVVHVPPEVVHVLQNAIATKTVQSKKADGTIDNKQFDYSAIPWRKV